jgi:hypothetical protein
MHADINGGEHHTAVDSCCKTTAAHLKRRTNARDTLLSRFAAFTPAHLTCMDRHCRATGPRTFSAICLASRDTSNTFDVTPLSTFFFRASHLERTALAGQPHAARFVASRPRTRNARQLHGRAFRLYTSCNSCTPKSRSASKKNLEIGDGRIGYRRFWAPFTPARSICKPKRRSAPMHRNQGSPLRILNFPATRLHNASPNNADRR